MMFTSTQSRLIQEVYDEQLHIYKTYKPMNRKTFKEYPLIVKDMAKIEALRPANDADRLKVIRRLEDFNRIWFPDTSIEEQYEILSKLEKARYLFATID